MVTYPVSSRFGTEAYIVEHVWQVKRCVVTCIIFIAMVLDSCPCGVLQVSCCLYLLFMDVHVRANLPVL